MTQAPYTGLVYTLLFVLLLGITSWWLNNNTRSTTLQESFIPSFSLLIDEKPDKLRIAVPKNLKTPSLLSSGIKNIVIIESEGKVTSDTNESVVIDAFTARETLFGQDKGKSDLKEIKDIKDIKSHHLLTTIDTERIAYFIRSLETRSRGFVEDDVRIGYVNELDKLLIKSLMMTKKNNNTMTSYSLKQISPRPSITTKTFEDNGIDVLFIYDTLYSEGLTKSIDKGMKLEVWDYAHTLDIHKLKVLFPFIKHKNIDFSLHFPQLKGKLDIVSSVVAFDNLIMLSHKDSTNPNIITELQQLVKYYNKPENINMYERYFPISQVAADYAQQRTQFFLERGTLEILEQFQQSPTPQESFVFDVKENVNGFFDSQSKRFYVYSDSIIGIPLKKDSSFMLLDQVRDEQNGVYKVVSVTTKQSILEKVRDLDNTRRQKQSALGSKLQPGFLCYNRPDITSKASCDSPYDIEGNVKKQKTYWDKPCEKHTDCPFYQSNKNYPNYRGGCIDGRCEMPIGIKSVSYRLYDKETSIPLCHNCNSSSPLCCEDQKDKKKYAFLKGPDYAFELDEYERPLSLLSKNRM